MRLIKINRSASQNKSAGQQQKEIMIKKLELTGNLHPELVALGLQKGDQFSNFSGPHKNGAVHFTVSENPVSQSCSVWPENYKIIETQTK